MVVIFVTIHIVIVGSMMTKIRVCRVIGCGLLYHISDKKSIRIQYETEDNRAEGLKNAINFFKMSWKSGGYEGVLK